MSATQDFHTRWLAAIDAQRAGSPPDETLQGIAEPGFAIYANTGLVACADALEANFRRVTHRLGQPLFRSLAIRYARQHPATDARLYLYGESFVGFLRDGNPAGDGPILTQLACLDWKWMQAHVAADAKPLDHKRWATLAPATLASATLQLAPATHWHCHALLPIWDLWSAARTVDLNQNVSPKHGQAVLITRPDDDVLTCEMNVAGCAFLHASAQGLSFADAAEAALQRVPGTDLQSLLSLLFAQGAFKQSESIFTPTGDHP
jgi:hypothetical protein